MRAIRDLRDLVNVSRLTYREDSDNEIENDYRYPTLNNKLNNYLQSPVISRPNQIKK